MAVIASMIANEPDLDAATVVENGSNRSKASAFFNARSSARWARPKKTALSGEAGAVVVAQPRLMPALADAYEQLRRAAAESSRHSPSLQGLGILIQRGMAAWMSACTAVTSSTPTPTTPVVGDVVHMLPSAQRDVIDLLAAMALTITPEVRKSSARPTARSKHDI